MGPPNSSAIVFFMYSSTAGKWSGERQKKGVTKKRMHRKRNADVAPSRAKQTQEEKRTYLWTFVFVDQRQPSLLRGLIQIDCEPRNRRVTLQRHIWVHADAAKENGGRGAAGKGTVEEEVRRWVSMCRMYA